MSFDHLDLEDVEQLLKANLNKAQGFKTSSETKENAPDNNGKDHGSPQKQKDDSKEENTKKNEKFSKKTDSLKIKKKSSSISRSRSRSKSSGSPTNSEKSSKSKSSSNLKRSNSGSKSRKNKNNEKSRSHSRNSASSSRSQRKNKNNDRKYKPKFQDKYSKKDEPFNKHSEFTCVLLNLAGTTNEIDIFNFMCRYGKIKDIKIIRDLKTKKSKGFAYVEYHDKYSFEKALDASGKFLNGNEILIQPAQNEKNKGFSSQKKTDFKYPKKKPPPPQDDTVALKKVYVGGLLGNLAELKEQDIKDLFSSVGEVDFVEIHRDLITGKSKGYAFVQFKDPDDAKEAIEKMDGMKIIDQTIKVSLVQPHLPGAMNSFNNYANSESLDLDDESGHNFLHNSQSRSLLMQKLTRANQANSHITRAFKDEISQTPTNCLLFVNMYTQEDILSIKNFLINLKKDLNDECKKHGNVKHLFVDPEIEGNIWVKFIDMNSATNAYKNLNERFFGNKKMLIYFAKEAYFKKKFSI